MCMSFLLQSSPQSLRGETEKFMFPNLDIFSKQQKDMSFSFVLSNHCFMTSPPPTHGWKTLVFSHIFLWHICIYIFGNIIKPWGLSACPLVCKGNYQKDKNKEGSCLSSPSHPLSLRLRSTHPYNPAA